MLAGLMGFVTGSFGSGAIQLIVGLLFVAIGKGLRDSASRDKNAILDPE